MYTVSSGRPPSTSSLAGADSLIRRITAFIVRSGIFVPLLFIGLLLWLDPFTQAGDVDYDEGINLMKSMLYGMGFKLYIDIWDDQPPLFTVLGSWWAALWGPSVPAARFLVALFSALLLWCFYLACRRDVSVWAATLAVILLAISQYYLRLSAAVMIGLPALALTMLAVVLLVRGRQSAWQIALSGAIMALALQTKFIMVLVVPAMALHLLLSQDTIPMRQRLRRLVIWLAGLALTSVLLLLYFRKMDLSTVLGTHLLADLRAGSTDANRAFLLQFARLHAAYLLLAGVGVVYAWRRAARGALLPTVWLVTVVVALTGYATFRYHYAVLLAVPLCWLAAYGVEAAIALLKQPSPGMRRPLQGLRIAAVLAATALVLAVLLVYPAPLAARLHEQSAIYRPLYDWNLVQRLIQASKLQPGYVFTDHAYYAFQAGQPVPPPIAVLSSARMNSLTSDAPLLDALTTFTPRYVLLERFRDRYTPAVMDVIDHDYTLVQDTGTGRLYQRLPEDQLRPAATP